MSAARRLSPADLDLRIKAGAAFACDLSTRVKGPGDAGGHHASRVTRIVDSSLTGSDTHPWLRGFVYLGFALAIAIPWVLLFADQLSG